MSDEREFILVADERTGKVGCAIIQAMYGGTVPSSTLSLLGEWEVGEIEHMRPYRISGEQLDRLVEERSGNPS